MVPDRIVVFHRANRAIIIIQPGPSHVFLQLIIAKVHMSHSYYRPVLPWPLASAGVPFLAYCCHWYSSRWKLRCRQKTGCELYLAVAAVSSVIQSQHLIAGRFPGETLFQVHSGSSQCPFHRVNYSDCSLKRLNDSNKTSSSRFLVPSVATVAASSADHRVTRQWEIVLMAT